ncbi:MAG: lipoyl(octanoyl) transferase LipB [Spirochaetaceae bacterium]
MILRICDIGRIGYEEALEMQRRAVTQRQREEIPDTLYLLEHPPVITMGKSAVEADILSSREDLTAAGATVHYIERGGETTYHGPGQLVGYVIFHLYQHQRKLKKFVENLEEVFIRLLAADFGIEAGRDPEHRGVWVGKEKIAAIGIAVKEAVTMHGFAFNVAPDLSHFNWIVPCGIRDRGQTSLERLLGHTPNPEMVKDAVAESFAEVFGYEEIRLEGDCGS